MSKAFVKESDDEADLPDELPTIPSNFKNYMTPSGHRDMQDELRQLLRVERPKVVETVAWAAGNGDRSENGDYIYGKRRLREIDRRIRFLTKRLESAEVVDPRQQKKLDQVFFGATVTYATEDGTEKTITIVGIDEADLVRGQVSWVSPIARAMMKASEGDVVELRAPAGVEQLEVLEIRYGGADGETDVKHRSRLG
jgi:transcription elongation factor GreB